LDIRVFSSQQWLATTSVRGQRLAMAEKGGRQPEEGLPWPKRSDCKIRGGRAMTRIQIICVIALSMVQGEAEVAMQQPVRADNKRQR
jgi:hypothetical protein